MQYRLDSKNVITFGRGKMPEGMRWVFERTLDSFKNKTDEDFICHTIPMNYDYSEACRTYIRWALGEPDNNLYTLTCFLCRELGCKECDLKYEDVRAHRIKWLERLANGIW